MKIKKQHFSPDENEYSFELVDEYAQRKLNMWIILDEYNKLTHDEIFDIVKVVYNESINIDFIQDGESGFKLGDKNIYVSYCVDPKTTLNIDRIRVLNEDEFKIFLDYVELKTASLN